MSENPQLDNRIAIFAGNGILPRQLVESLLNKGIKPYVIALTDITDKATTEGVETLWSRIGSVGKIIDFLNTNQVKQIAFAGGLKRPSFTSMIPDMVGLKLLNQLRKLENAGDSALFDTIIKFLTERGFDVLGIDQVAEDMVVQKGPAGKIQPHKKHLKDIVYGNHIATEIGKLDIGQAVIVQNALTLGVEGLDGTDALITRCSSLQEDGKGAILVKIRKPKQDRRIDLPTIGPKTIERLHEHNYAGVAVEAGNSLILTKEETIRKADELGIFIYGI